MQREVVLAQKTRDIQESLESWALESGLLSPGEQLVFSLRIEGSPIVVRNVADMEPLLEMKVIDFFNAERLRMIDASCGRKGIATRVFNVIREQGYMDDNCTLRNFLQKETVTSLLRYPNSGRLCTNVLREVFKNVGLVLREK
ncbi:MAG: hypothetical protein JWN64_750 [Parcubacteria group bacterium]|nr:hypothetical protein [Parcubacteria group bacterium]